MLLVDGRPDFSSRSANHVVAGIADLLPSRLMDSADFGRVAIVPDGLEITTSASSMDDGRFERLARSAFDEARDALPAADRSIAREARLHVRRVSNDRATLQRLSARIGADRRWQQARGIDVSMWGADTDGSMTISLRRYDDASAVMLTKRYGDAVRVWPADRQIAQ